jgi:hypothetical protein
VAFELCLIINFLKLNTAKMTSNPKVNIKGAQKINQKVISKKDSAANKTTGRKQTSEASEEKKMATSAASKNDMRNENADSDNLNTAFQKKTAEKLPMH